jgi:hypothetical protein
MTDSQGRQGGSSNIQIVEATGDNTCLTDAALSSTFADTATSVITSTIPTTTTTSSTATNNSKSTTAPPPTTKALATHISVGAIAGSVIGGMITVAALVTLGLFCLRQRANHGNYGEGGSRRFSRRLGSFDNLHDPGAGASNVHSYMYSTNSAQASTYTLTIPPGAMEFNPYLLHPPPPVHTSPTRSSSSHHGDSPNDVDGETSVGSVTSTARRKAALAGETSYKPTRFVLHTDLDDSLRPNSDGVVELPPQYTDRREPQTSEGPLRNPYDHP